MLLKPKKEIPATIQSSITVASPTTFALSITLALSSTLASSFTSASPITIALQTTFAPIEPLTLNLRLAYTYQRARDLSDPTSDYYGGQIPYIPRHSGSVTFSGHYKTWDLNYSFIYTGERYDSSANIAANYIQPWYTHDLSLSKAFQWSKAGLKLTAEVNNLFNQQYEVVRCYPMPGINFRAIAQVTF